MTAKARIEKLEKAVALLRSMPEGSRWTGEDEAAFRTEQQKAILSALVAGCEEVWGIGPDETDRMRVEFSALLWGRELGDEELTYLVDTVARLLQLSKAERNRLLRPAGFDSEGDEEGRESPFPTSAEPSEAEPLDRCLPEVEFKPEPFEPVRITPTAQAHDMPSFLGPDENAARPAY
jgi:hypothetical protein